MRGLFPAFHRGHDVPPDTFPAKVSAHDAAKLLHGGQQPCSQAPRKQGIAHGELQELSGRKIMPKML